MQHWYIYLGSFSFFARNFCSFVCSFMNSNQLYVLWNLRYFFLYLKVKEISGLYFNNSQRSYSCANYLLYLGSFAVLSETFTCLLLFMNSSQFYVLLNLVRFFLFFQRWRRFSIRFEQLSKVVFLCELFLL